MAAKRMTSARIDGDLKATVERLAGQRGETVSAFHERALAREALRASGAAVRPGPLPAPTLPPARPSSALPTLPLARPQPVQKPVEDDGGSP